MNSLINSSILPSPTPRSTNSELGDSQSLPLIQSLGKLEQPSQQQKKSIAHIYTEQALIYLKEQNWRKAIVACKNALEIAPDTAEAYKILGDILYRQGKKADALGIYAKALALDPNLAAVYANVGTLYADQKKWHKALDYYQQAVIIDSNLAGTYRNLAQVWEELGDTDKALECFCRAIDLEPETLAPEEYFKFGTELYQQGKTKEASILFTHGVKLNPQAQTELAQLVQMLEELEEWQQAVVYYHQLISLPIDDDQTHSNSVNKPIKKLLSNSKTKSLAAKVSAEEARQKIALLPQKLAIELLPKVNTAIAHAEETSACLAVKSSDSNSPAKLVSSESDNDSTTVEIPAANTADIAASQPDSAKSWNNLGSLYAQKQEWTKAISCYQEALQLDPQFAKSYRNLAKVYNQLGEEIQAALHWYEAFSLEPELVKPEEYFSLAKKLLEHQQLDKAIACLRRTIQLDPNFEQAYLTLGKLLENQGKLEQSQACYARLESKN